jgi:hypothetical protein
MLEHHERVWREHRAARYRRESVGRARGHVRRIEKGHGKPFATPG